MNKDHQQGGQATKDKQNQNQNQDTKNERSADQGENAEGGSDNQ